MDLIAYGISTQCCKKSIIGLNEQVISKIGIMLLNMENGFADCEWERVNHPGIIVYFNGGNSLLNCNGKGTD